MGFGYGHTTHHADGTARDRETGERVAATFTTDMVAHVWAQRTQTFGKSGNGNFYFEADALFSYGSHFLCAYLFERSPGEVVALHTLESHSATTSGHCSTARGASRHLPGAWVPELTALRDDLPTLVEFTGKPRQLKAAAKAGDWRAARAIKTVRAWLDSFQYKGADSGDWRGSFEVDGVALIAEAAGISSAELARIQRRRAKRLEAEQAARDRREREGELRDATDFAALSDSDFRAIWPKDGTRQWETGDGSKPYDLEQSLRLAKRLYKAARAASSKGWNRIASEVRRKEKLLRAHIAGRNERLHAAYRKGRADELRSWRAGTGKRPPAYVFSEDSFPAIYRALVKAERVERADAIAKSFEDWQAGNARTRPPLANFEAGTRQYEAIAESIREERRAFELAAADWLANPEARAAGAPDLATDAHYAKLSEAPEVTSARDALRDRVRREKRTRAERDKLEEAQAARDAWLAGESSYWRGDDGNGGALMRIRGDTLETSQGADVPLSHAVKVFRFVKACREAGKAWRRNGATIRVGHFQVDSVDASGNFRAGCHSFNWPEVERVAKLAGVDDAPAIAEPQAASA